MRVFIVVTTRNPQAVARAITALNLESFEVKEDTRLVASNSTTRALAEELGIRAGKDGSAGIVCLIDGYSGRLSKDAWDWLGLHEAKRE